MPTSLGHETYLSVFSWRYGSKEMRELWSMEERARQQRRIWVAAAHAQNRAGLVSDEELADLEVHQDDVDVEAVFAREQTTKHDIIAAIEIFQEQCPVGGGKIHLGMTSEDNTSNLDIVLLKRAVTLVMDKLRKVLLALCTQVDRHADLKCAGYTHLQAATTTTVGYRLAQYLQDFFMDHNELEGLWEVLKGKGLKGATGTRASFVDLLQDDDRAVRLLEESFLVDLRLEAFPVAGQTYPRKVDLRVLQALASLSQSLHRFANDLRIQQSSPFNELGEPFSKGQRGSSAMPWKKNPINAENICSMARLLPAFCQVAWENASLCALDRTLDESANRRIILPTAFLLIDESLKRALKIIEGLVVKEKVIARNLRNFSLFTGIEAVLMKLVDEHGQDRQEMHSLLAETSQEAWSAIEEGFENPLLDLLEERLKVWMDRGEIEETLECGAYNVGDAPDRARALAHQVHGLFF